MLSTMKEMVKNTKQMSHGDTDQMCEFCEEDATKYVVIGGDVYFLCLGHLKEYASLCRVYASLDKPCAGEPDTYIPSDEEYEHAVTVPVCTDGNRCGLCYKCGAFDLEL